MFSDDGTRLKFEASWDVVSGIMRCGVKQNSCTVLTAMAMAQDRNKSIITRTQPRTEKQDAMNTTQKQFFNLGIDIVERGKTVWVPRSAAEKGFRSSQNRSMVVLCRSSCVIG